MGESNSFDHLHIIVDQMHIALLSAIHKITFGSISGLLDAIPAYFYVSARFLESFTRHFIFLVQKN